jgi:hypothetical protein
MDITGAEGRVPQELADSGTQFDLPGQFLRRATELHPLQPGNRQLQEGDFAISREQGTVTA